MKMNNKLAHIQKLKEKDIVKIIKYLDEFLYCDHFQIKNTVTFNLACKISHKEFINLENLNFKKNLLCILDKIKKDINNNIYWISTTNKVLYFKANNNLVFEKNLGYTGYSITKQKK